MANDRTVHTGRMISMTHESMKRTPYIELMLVSSLFGYLLEQILIKGQYPLRVRCQYLAVSWKGIFTAWSP